MNGANGLFNSTTLDVIVGLVFVYLLLAIMCTTINEWLDGMLKTRSSNLASGIKQLLDAQPDASGKKDGFLQRFYAHPLITGMLAPGKSGERAYPSYLPARTFATAVMDIHLDRAACVGGEFPRSSTSRAHYGTTYQNHTFLH